jgi:hypothetical protein
MIYYRISGAITILTPSREGKIVIQYRSGRTEIADVGGLWADKGIKEVNDAIGTLNESFDFANWQDPDKWHNGKHVSKVK